MHSKRILSWVLSVTLAFTVGVWVNAQEVDPEYGRHYTLLGDLTLDEKIGADDALEILKLVVGKTENDRVLPAADVNRDGQVGADDALDVLKYTVGKSTQLDTPEQVVIHLWGEWKTLRQPSAQQDGLLQRDCEFCEAYEQKPVAYVAPVGELEQAVLVLVNEERAKVGLNPLSYYSAGQYAGDIRANELNTLFSHTRPDDSSCFTVIEHEVDWFALGENIAMGQQTPAQVMDSWMNSKGHRENILNESFTHLIVGVVPCKYEGYVGYCWVQLFIGM